MHKKIIIMLFTIIKRMKTKTKVMLFALTPLLIIGIGLLLFGLFTQPSCSRVQVTSYNKGVREYSKLSNTLRGAWSRGTIANQNVAVMREVIPSPAPDEITAISVVSGIRTKPYEIANNIPAQCAHNTCNETVMMSFCNSSHAGTFWLPSRMPETCPKGQCGRCLLNESNILFSIDSVKPFNKTALLVRSVQSTAICNANICSKKDMIRECISTYNENANWSGPPGICGTGPCGDCSYKLYLHQMCVVVTSSYNNNNNYRYVEDGEYQSCNFPFGSLDHVYLSLKPLHVTIEIMLNTDPYIIKQRSTLGTMDFGKCSYNEMANNIIIAGSVIVSVSLLIIIILSVEKFLKWRENRKNNNNHDVSSDVYSDSSDDLSEASFYEDGDEGDEGDEMYDYPKKPNMDSLNKEQQNKKNNKHKNKGIRIKKSMELPDLLRGGQLVGTCNYNNKKKEENDNKNDNIPTPIMSASNRQPID